MDNTEALKQSFLRGIFVGTFVGVFITFLALGIVISTQGLRVVAERNFGPFISPTPAGSLPTGGQKLFERAVGG